MKEYRYITLREKPELMHMAAEWFHSKGRGRPQPFRGPGHLFQEGVLTSFSILWGFQGSARHQWLSSKPSFSSESQIETSTASALLNTMPLKHSPASVQEHT